MSSIDWRAVAGVLGGLIPPGRLHPEVLARARSAPARRGPWLAAFSGGCDSLCLLLLLWQHWPARRGRLVAAHFNHRLRGEESEGDAAFCAEVCAGLGLELATGRWDNPPPGASEAQAREARHAFFSRELLVRGGHVLWTGHQLDDVAETLLMRLARGSGAAGLCAPRPVRAGCARWDSLVLRPLLALSREFVSKSLIQAGACWREDSSNRAGAYLRNRMRASVLPAWRESSGQHDALAGAALSRRLLEEDEQALQHWVDELGVLGPGPRLDLRPLPGLPRAVLRRALLRWLTACPYRGDLSRQGFEQLLEACQRGAPTRFSLGQSGLARIRRGILSFERSSEP